MPKRSPLNTTLDSATRREGGRVRAGRAQVGDVAAALADELLAAGLTSRGLKLLARWLERAEKRRRVGG